MSEGLPRIKPKSPERLQAQAEIYADKGTKAFSDDQYKLLKYSGELAQITDLNNLPEGLSPELVELVNKHKDSYMAYLRQEKKLETEFLEKNIKTYRESFRPVIAELKKRIAEGNPKDLPEYLGSGSNGSAYKIEVDGKEYAAKFSRNITNVNFETKPLIQAEGLPHVSQLQAYSFDDGVAIMNLLPGTEVTNFNNENAPDYSPEQIARLIDTVRSLDERGLIIDPKASNFIFDQKEGFSVLDYHLKKPGSRYGLPQEIMDLRHALTYRKYPIVEYDSPEYKLQQVEKYKIFLPTTVKFLTVLHDKYPDILDAWKKQHAEDKANPNMGVSEIIPRELIPDIPEFAGYLQQLESLGF